MQNKRCSRAVILTTLALLGTSSLSIAQTPLSESQCTDLEIKKHIQQLNNGEPAAFDALVKCNSKAVPYLTKALENEDENLRITIITALGEIGEKATPALLLLNKSLKDPNLDVRIITIYALRKIGKDAVPALITTLRDKNGNVRSNAADALGRIGKDAKAAVPALITALQDKNGNVRSNAADALGRIGSDLRALGLAGADAGVVCI